MGVVTQGRAPGEIMECSNKIKNRKAFLEKLEGLKCLKLPLGEYAITGSGPMAVRGLREANDIDVVVKKTLWLELLKRFVPYDSKHMKIGNIEIWGDFLNLTERIDDVIDSAEPLAGYPFVTLQDTLSWKKFLNREKDQKDIKMIEETLSLFPGIYTEKPMNFSPALVSVACYMTSGNKMLFLQKAEGQWSAEKWGIPCGKIEEEELSEAMAREVLEETGVKIDKDSLKYTGYFYIVSLERLQYIFHTFSYQLHRDVPVMLSDEHRAFKWVSYEEAHCLNLIPFQKEVLVYQKQKLRLAGTAGGIGEPLMKSMEQKIIDWVQTNPKIKALLLVGSRAQQNMVDELSDYDVSVFTDSISSIINEDQWLNQFGKVWICVHEHKEWEGQSFPTRLVIFEGGIKVDFSFWPTDLLKRWNQGAPMPDDLMAGFNILVDKEKLTQNLPKHPKPLTSKPTQQMFDTVIQEFWFEAYHVSKYLKRNDLWSALFRMGLLRDHFLLKMIEWNEQARSNWTVLLHPNGKNLHSWVCPETREAVQHVFAHFDQTDCWDALKHAINLFRRSAAETAAMCGFTLSELDQTMTEYIFKRMQNGL
ncbi:TPA: NUDIX domain-containing protein [Candidatus Woesearchaeota archaeon]|nr:NUDIX domain-containing protein [Candidatus Woesearchaeota archaeon]